MKKLSLWGVDNTQNTAGLQLGYRSAYAHSQTLRDGQEASEGLSEQAVHVLTPRDINELAPKNVIAIFYHYKPIWLKRMDWRVFGLLKKHHSYEAPPLIPLPPITDIKLSDTQTLSSDNYSHEDDDLFPVTLDDPDNLPGGRQDLVKLDGIIYP